MVKLDKIKKKIAELTGHGLSIKEMLPYISEEMTKEDLIAIIIEYQLTYLSPEETEDMENDQMLLTKILSHQEILPILLHIDPELDKKIAEKLS